MNRSLAVVDWLALSCLVCTGIFFLLAERAGWAHWTAAGLNLGMAAGILGLQRARSLPSFLQWLRELYPLVFVLLLYAQADYYVHLLHEPPNYDGLVRSWDAALFGGHPHEHLSRWLSGWMWKEVFHFLYLSYFLLLTGAFLWIRARHPRQFPRFAFVVIGSFMSFAAFFVAFPVAGPLAMSDVCLPSRGWFPQMVTWLYQPLRTNGIATGAFPSSHVGMSVVIACLLAPRQWTSRVCLWGLVVGIALSTVYGQFHYAIDAIGGAVAGGLFFVAWSRLYALLQERGKTRLETRRRDA